MTLAPATRAVIDRINAGIVRLQDQTGRPDRVIEERATRARTDLKTLAYRKGSTRYDLNDAHARADELAALIDDYCPPVTESA